MDAGANARRRSKRGAVLHQMSAIVFIPLTQHKVAVIDFDDFEKVRPYKWYAQLIHKQWYATRLFYLGGKRKTGYLHILLCPGGGKEVHHIDGDGLNNRRLNLQRRTHAQNLQGFQRKKTGASSRFRGVCWFKRDSVWVSYLKKNGRLHHLGRFENEEDAARAYDAAARKYFGEFASPNFTT